MIKIRSGYVVGHVKKGRGTWPLSHVLLVSLSLTYDDDDDSGVILLCIGYRCCYRCVHLDRRRQGETPVQIPAPIQNNPVSPSIERSVE